MKPIAVLISDVHYSVHTLEVADRAMRLAITKANKLEVPLIICGDLHDTKANLRGECVKAIMDTLETADLQPYILRGNHDQINEKSIEHSLEFLRETAKVVTEPGRYDVELETGEYHLGYLIPYYHDPEELKAYLKTIPKGSRLIMHQGVTNSNAGHYIQDKSAVDFEDVKDFQVISGHYHTRQRIITNSKQTGWLGTWSYVGNPYTLTYGETNDPSKGYQVLYDDGALEFVPTNLRKHVIWNEVIGQQIDQPSVSEGDIWWIKVHGTREQLAGFNKSSIPTSMPFRLDLIPTDIQAPAVNPVGKTQEAVLDSLIEGWQVSADQVTRLKQTWRELCRL